MNTAHHSFHNNYGHLKTLPDPARFAANETAELPTLDKFIINIFTIW
jgi:hypothetical protein